MNKQPFIIGHRGASAYAPENTLAAIQAAVDADADGVEFDVQLASDGIPVVIHDPTLDRTGSLPGSVSEFSSKELGMIDVGSWFNAKYPKRSDTNYGRQTIPTLAQVLELLGSFPGLVYIELKPTKSNFRQLAKAVCDEICDSHLLPQMILKSFRLAAIPEIKHYLPKVQTAALFEPTVMSILRRRKHILTIAREFGADQISLHHSLVTKKLMSLASREKVPVTVWTTDKAKWVSRCRDLGIRALITNDPANLVRCRENNF